MRTILVTGGAGFIGSHVVDLIAARGARPIVVDDLSTGTAANVPDGVPLHLIDIADRIALLALVEALPHVDGIIHCAAQASVVTSTIDPGRDLVVNVAGTINVLDIANALGCPLVFASTGGAIYGDGAIRPTPETAAVDPGAPYGASKAAAEIYVRLWARSAGLPHAICRLGNVYGPRQRGDGEAGVVAIFATRLRAGLPLVLYGEGSPTRDYVHVGDVARALVDALGTEGLFNVATGIETPVHHVLMLVEQGVRSGNADGVALAPLRPGELSASCLDTARVKRVLGWEPEIGVSEGIPAVARAIAEAATNPTSAIP